MRHPVTAMISALALLAPIQAAGQRTATRCDISAFVVDRDTAGLNVRSAPSSSAPVLRTLSNAGSGVARIVGQNGAWFRVSAIVDAEDDATLFRGDGWVHASLLGTSVANEDPRLYAAPRRQARALARLIPDASLVTLIGCDGAWAQVRAAGRVGWLSPGGQCSNPLTTCV